MASGKIYQTTHPGTKYEGKEGFKHLYHYTSFSSFLKIYYGKRLKYGCAVNMNDILEANKRKKVGYRNQYPLLFSLKDVLNSYRQISFTMDYDTLIKGCMSNAMWYHYGDKYDGVCIEFDYDKIAFPENSVRNKVSYNYLLSDNILLPQSAETVNDVEKYVRDNMDQIFFVKTKEWEYENEYRIVCQNEDYLDVDGAIKAIFFTNCESDYVKITESIVGDEFPIRFINYYSECGEITPIDDGTKSMRRKIEGIEQRHKGHKTWMQQAEEYYLMNKNDKNKSLLLDRYFD